MNEMSADAPLALEMRGVAKSFGPLKALSDVSLSVRAGEVHALMGENGAGKSTLMKVLSGAHAPDPGGAIFIAGAPVPPANPKAARAMGVAVIYQELTLAPNLSIAENLFLGEEPRRFGFIDRAEMRRRAQPALERLGLARRPDELVATLSLGERQLVEIARALTADARIIVMDEPTTSLSNAESERLYAVIDRLKSQNIAIIFISHRMEEVYRLSDRCSVLRDGRYVGMLERDELNADRLVAMMVGRDMEGFYQKAHKTPAEDAQAPLFEAEDLGDGARIGPASFKLYRGEILAFAGLVGSGRTELARLIYGAPVGGGGIFGRTRLAGKALSISRPEDALKAGIAYLTEDRKGLGLFLDRTIAENVNLNVLSRDARAGGALDLAKARRRARKAVETLSIRTESINKTARRLSGGNQQKVLLARLLETDPKLVILDEPTRGVDIGAKSEIYKLIDALAQRGVGVIVISSDLPEVIGVADRVLVMRAGRIVGEVRPDAAGKLSQEKIGLLATGSAGAAETPPPPCSR